MGSYIDRFLVLLCKLIARMPFWVIQGMADIFYVLLFYVLRYRRKIVNLNLTNSFPKKSPKEIRMITKKFYHHISDLGLETIKFYGMTEAEFDDRFKIHNLDIYEKYYQKGKSIIVVGMHYNNWEWSAAMQRYVKHLFLGVYNPFSNNKLVERFILDIRERFGADSIPFSNAPRAALEGNSSKRPRAIVLYADQTPPPTSQFWTTFLNQETAFFAGVMKIAKKTNQPVVLHHTRKTGRGRYEIFSHILIDNPSEVEPEEILRAYINKLEEIIKDEPQYWLWSHRRWKHKRPANIKLHDR